MVHSTRTRSTVDFSNCVFWNRLDTRKRAQSTGDRQPAQSYLLIINTHSYQKLPAYQAPLPLYRKKWQNTGIPTHSLHGSHTYARAQTYTRENVPGRLRHPSLTYNFHTLIYVPFSWNRLTIGNYHWVKRDKNMFLTRMCFKNITLHRWTWYHCYYLNVTFKLVLKLCTNKSQDDVVPQPNHTHNVENTSCTNHRQSLRNY